MGSLKEINPSLWVATTTAPEYPALPGDIDVDVVIVGAGIAGLTAAALAKREGLRVAVVEAGRMASGATGYTSAEVTVVHGLIYDTLCDAYGDDTARRYADANRAGMAALFDLIVGHGIGCDLERRPAFTYTCDPETVETVAAEVAAAQRIGLPSRFTTDTDLPYRVEAAIVVDDQAQFHPRKYC